MASIVLNKIKNILFDWEILWFKSVVTWSATKVKAETSLCSQSINLLTKLAYSIISVAVGTVFIKKD